MAMIKSDLTTNIQEPPRVGTTTHEKKIESELNDVLQERNKYISGKCRNLRKTLNLSSTNVDDLDALTIAVALNEQIGKLEVIDLSSNQLTDEGFINILSGLQWHPHLRELHLGENNFTVISMMALSDVISVFKSLELLSLERCGLTDECIVPLAYSLGELERLQTLRLSGNSFGDEALISLSILLSMNQLRCRNLYLGNNTFTSKGLKPFLKALEMNSTVGTLYLNNIEMDEAALKSLAKGVTDNECLNELVVSECGIEDQGALQLKTMLALNKTLVKFDLAGNKITDAAAQELLATVVKQNKTLISLVLTGNSIENEKLIDDARQLALLRQQ